MTEFDFEELDKAVSDLMQDGTTVPGSEPVVSTVNVPDASQAQAVKPVQPPAEPLAVKRRGKFMDMIHPAQGVNSRPLVDHGANKVEDTLVSKEHEVSDNNQESISTDNTPDEDKPAENIDYAANPATVNEWPDPIDVMESHEQEKEPSGDSEQPTDVELHQGSESGNDDNEQLQTEGGLVEDEPEVNAPEVEVQDNPDTVQSEPEVLPSEPLDTVIEPEFLPEQEQLSSTDSTQDTPVESDTADIPSEPEAAMESPFLLDTKVDKRPLGVFSQDSEPVASANSQPGATEPSLPIELSSELMNLESNTSVGDAKQEAAVATGAAVEATGGVKEAKASSQQEPVKPSDEPKTNGAIYDTNTYHQPIAVQTSKKHTWVVYIIWALALLIAGAIAGAIYFYISTR